MTTTKWKSGVSGDFNTSGNWTAGVPGSGDTALITAGGTYTVTSSAVNTVATLALAKNATLDIAGHHFVITTGTATGGLAGTIDVTNLTALVLGTNGDTTTFTNTGTINLQSGSGAADNAKLNIAGDVTLTGKGKVDMSGNDAEVIVSESTAATLNNDSTIAGDGVVGDLSDALLTFNNGKKGVLDGNTPGGLLVATDGTSVTNSGLMEATTASGSLILTGDITQNGNGTIKSATAGATVTLESADITGGKVSTVKNAFLNGTGATGMTTIDAAATIANAGTIECDTGDFLIENAVSNSGTLLAGSITTTDFGLIEVDGKVTGGRAELDGGVVVFDQAATAAVTFDAAGGNLDLFDATKFTGKVSGMAGNPDATIDLENITFTDGVHITQPGSNGILTVTDLKTGATDKIKIVGGGTFSASGAFDGSTLISDPPASPTSVPNIGTQLLAQSMASFGASGGIAAPGADRVAGQHLSSDFLASPQHG